MIGDPLGLEYQTQIMQGCMYTTFPPRRFPFFPFFSYLLLLTYFEVIFLPHESRELASLCSAFVFSAFAFVFSAFAFVSSAFAFVSSAFGITVL